MIAAKVGDLVAMNLDGDPNVPVGSHGIVTEVRPNVSWLRHRCQVTWASGHVSHPTFEVLKILRS